MVGDGDDRPAGPFEAPHDREADAGEWASVEDLALLVLFLAFVLGRSDHDDSNRDFQGPRPFPTRQVDINTDPVGILEALPKVGPVLAERIVKAREERPFASVADLDRRVRGIGPKTIDQVRPHLRPHFGPPETPR